MAIAMALKDYLTQHKLHYDVVPHPKSHTSVQSARLAHVPADCVAKSVVLEDDDGYLMAIVPCSRHVKLGVLSKALHRRLRLATESELRDLFKDCELGAIPPLGSAYGMMMVVDEALLEKPDVYFEAGDHEELVHMAGGQFMAMIGAAQRGRFSEQAPAMRHKEPLYEPGQYLDI